MDMSKKLSVAIDTAPMRSGHRVRGIGVHTNELVAELQKKKYSSQVQVDAVDLERANLTKYDIIHFPSFNPYFNSFRLVPGKKVVVTIHDLIYLVYPTHYPPGTRGKFRWLKQKQLLTKVEAIMTISETSKKDICRFVDLAPEKVHVVHLAPKERSTKLVNPKGMAKIRKKYNLPKQFVLYVGDVNYNKNIVNLVRACKLAKVQLVIAGKHAKDVENLGLSLYELEGPRDWLRFLADKPHPEKEHYVSLKREFDENNVSVLGFVSDDELAVMFKLATLYCQPSRYEGFGLPPLEAMQAELPVVAGRTQALVEVLGNAALYADPESPQDLARQIKKLATSATTRKKYISLGAIQAKKYSWDKAAQETLDVYAKVGK